MAGIVGELSPYFIYLLITSTIGPLLFGYHLAELNAPQDVITCAVKQYSADYYPPALPQCIPMSTFEFGLVSSIFTVGGLVGALGAGPLAAKYGRLNTMRYTTVFFTLGPVAEACAASVWIMALGRFLSGVGAGAAVVVVPLFISEVAPPTKRGLFGSFTQVMINVGILIAQVLGYFLSRGQLWRIILGVGGVLGLSQLSGLSFGVESPQWAAHHGQPLAAKRYLQRIRGPGYDIQKEIDTWGSAAEHEGVQPRANLRSRLMYKPDEEQALLTGAPVLGGDSASNGTNKAGKRQTLGIFAVLGHPRYRKAVLAVMMVMVAQQFCGINSIVMYGVSLLSDLLKQSSALLNVAVAGINVFVTILCAPLADRLGRKPCLILSISGMGTSSLLLGFAILRHIPILSAISVLTFVASFGVGLGPVPFILASELVGPEAVSATQSWALAANWTATFVVAQFFPVINEALGKGRVYFLFAALAAFFATFVFFRVPETKGKKNADEVWGGSERTE